MTYNLRIGAVLKCGLNWVDALAAAVLLLALLVLSFVVLVHVAYTVYRMNVVSSPLMKQVYSLSTFITKKVAMERRGRRFIWTKVCFRFGRTSSIVNKPKLETGIYVCTERKPGGT